MYKKLLHFILSLIIGYSFTNTSKAQNFQWATHVGSAANTDYGRFISVDTNGNVLVTGSFKGTADFDPGAGIANLTSNGVEDVYFAKYDANGNYLWAKNIGSTSTDIGYGIETDNAGNVYVVGYYQSTVDFDPSVATATLTAVLMEDIFFAKYDANGNYLWAKSFGSKGTDYASNIKVDKTGTNIFITGFAQLKADFNPGVGIDSIGGGGFLTKYDSNGNYIWAVPAGNVPSNIDLDRLGNIYLIDYYETTPQIWETHFEKFDKNGSLVWRDSLVSTADIFGSCIDVDLNGNIIVNGYFSGMADFDPSTTTHNLTTNGGYDIFVAKYDSLGNYKWANQIGSTGNDFGYFIQADMYGNLYSTGSFQASVDFDPGTFTTNLTSNGSDDAYYAKYDANGNLLWANSIGSAGVDAGAIMKLDTKGNTYLTGVFGGNADFDPSVFTSNLTPTGTVDIFTMKLYVCNNPDTISGLISEPNTNLVSAGKVYVYKYQPGAHAGFLDTVGFVPINNGAYLFPTLPYQDYFVQAVADPSTYPTAVSTYYSNKLNNYRWDSAIFVPHVGCAGLHYPNINITVVETPAQTGSGIISGNVSNAGSFGHRLAGGGYNSVMGVPLKGVDVKLGKNPGGLCSQRTISDGVGNYQFTNVDTGSYFIFVDIPNFIDTINIVTLNASNPTSTNNNYCVDSSKVHYCSSQATGINQSGITGTKVSVYPNPSSGIFTLRADAYENASVEVYNLIGEKIFSDKLQATSTQLNLSRLPSGIYELRLIKNNITVYQTKINKID